METAERRRAGRPRLALKAYLAGLTALFVVAAGAAIWSGWSWAERDGLSAARTDAAFAAGKAADQIGKSLVVVRSAVDGVASSPSVGQVFTDPAACRLAFSLGGENDGHMDVLSPDGTVACSSRMPVDAQDAAAYRGASWLGTAMQAAQTATVVVDARTSRPGLLVSAPLPAGGAVIAVVDLVALGASSGEAFSGARGLEFVLTSADDSVVLTRWPDGSRWAGMPVTSSRFTLPDTDGYGTDVTGMARIYGLASVAGTGWRMYAGADRAAALATAHRLARRQSLIAVIGLLAGLLATALVYRRITRPIGRLRAAVHEAAVSGTAQTAIPVAGPREVSDLGAEFNALIATVERELAERRQAERDVRQHATNYRAMFDTSPFPMYLFDVETLDLVAVNDAATDFYGYPRETLLGMRVVDLCPEGDAAGVAEAVASAPPVERGVGQRHVRADGTVTQVNVTSHLTTFAGQLVRCAVVDDVDEREQLQRRLHQSERLESLGQLAGGIAHDFNNLLGVINGYAEMSAAEVAPAVSRDPTWRALHDDLLQIVAAGDRATALTRQLLAFARADVVAELRVLDLNTVVADVEKLLRRTLGEDITLVTHLGDGLMPVKADVGRLEQVLVNLAVNARDAMPGGGTLTIDTDTIVVDEHYAAQHPGMLTGHYTRLRVSDTGTGMSKETLERAFEPFFTTKPKGSGTGLGLATIYGIIAQAGGHAQIYSELGHGTTVAALLPVTHGSCEPTEPVSNTLRQGEGEIILVVEDDDSLRALTERILERNGYSVISARTAERARIEADGREVVDLLLTDVVLPGMHGPDLAGVLCRARPGMRVIYMSGYAETILAARSTVPAGATLLNKPVSAHQLLSAIARMLERNGRIVTP